MTTDVRPPGVPRGSAAQGEEAVQFLFRVARMLLEYSARAEVIRRQIDRMATQLGVRVTTMVGYLDVALTTDDGRSFHARVREHRIDCSTVSEMLGVLEDVCGDRVGLDIAAQRLEAAARGRPQFHLPLLAVIFGVAASALAWLLRADWGAIAISGVSAGLGVVVRRALARRHVLTFLPPFAAALIGALLGGIVVRLGWTQTPWLCLIVPSLMLVPGAHLIIGADDILQNQMLAGLGRMGLALGILVAATLGVLLGGWLTLGTLPPATRPSESVPLTLLLDISLAGVAACGFGAFFNSPWRVLWISIVCGMVGHGIRYVCLGEGIGLGISTLLACLAIGVIAGIAADRLRLPFAALAFAGAVPMMPGVSIYEGIVGAASLSRMGNVSDPAVAATTLALLFRSFFVVCAMAIGLLGGSRMALFFTSRTGRA